MLMVLMLGCKQNIGMEYEKSIASIHETITEAPKNWKADTMIRFTTAREFMPFARITQQLDRRIGRPSNPCKELFGIWNRRTEIIIAMNDECGCLNVMSIRKRRMLP